ncbi:MULTISPECIES: DarT ssDNA thymidine ADP-ribosyltransferase family protein [Segatella]|uniref:DarT ssDNA thymidine ADP-ribosyltransferase family protein n=2 Tax=Prevotellaceae TaxID=171552 RepID=UPI003AAFF6FA
MENNARFKKHIRYAFGILHKDNMPHVMKYGLVHNDSPFARDSFVPIGDMSVMDVRSTKQLPDGSFLSEYIPFYFGPGSPMLYNIQISEKITVNMIQRKVFETRSFKYVLLHKKDTKMYQVFLSILKRICNI